MDLNNALSQLPADQREALILVGAEGFSYEDAATISGCAVGTVKSRVNRARAKVSELLKAPADDATDEASPQRTARRVS
jgi:RNA polymerase sigma-70 factor (ECF subfamily)